MYYFSQAAYEESKKQIINLVVKKLKQLFAIQNSAERECAKEMEDLSRAFSILLHTATNCKSQSAFSTIVSSMCEMVRALYGNI